MDLLEACGRPQCKNMERVLRSRICALEAEVTSAERSKRALETERETLVAVISELQSELLHLRAKQANADDGRQHHQLQEPDVETGALFERQRSQSMERCSERERRRERQPLVA